MKKLLLVSLVVSLFINISQAQDSDAIVMTIADKPITKGEFEYIFNKNQTDTTQKESVKEYVDLFVKFKLKVIEAEARGLDTVASFISELSGYRDQLARPYLIDRELNEKLIKEAYERMSNEVKASHILIRCDFNNPEDTLKAYQKITELKSQLNNGANFEQVAIANSQDPSVANNKGDLGYFSGFQMVLPFEDAAFSTEVGSVSGIVKTRFGYHLLKVFDKRKSRGEVKVAHVLFLAQQESTQEQREELRKKALEVYTQIKDNELTFEEAAKQFSDDTQSASNGGELMWFGSGTMVPEFQETSFSLEEKGQMSEVFESRFGFHIVKLIDKRPYPSFESQKEDIKERLKRTERGKKPDESFIKKLKKEYNFKKHDDALADMVEISKKYTYRDSMFKVATRNLLKPVMTLNGIDYSLTHFADYLVKNNHGETPDEEKRVAIKFDRYHKEVIRDYEKSVLGEKYPDFGYLMQEYHDGILLFEISSEEVWDKASKDIEGMKAFHKKTNKNYKWEEPVFRGKVYYCANDSVKQIVSELVESETPDSVIIKQVNKMGPNVTINSGFYTDGKHNAIDADIFKSKEFEPHRHFQSALVTGKLYKTGTKQTFEETPRGKLISDYQNYLEKEWIKKLKKKYKIKLNKKVLKTVSIK